VDDKKVWFVFWLGSCIHGTLLKANEFTTHAETLAFVLKIGKENVRYIQVYDV